MKSVPIMDGILESSLYVEDVGRAVRFYEEIFGFRVNAEFGERGCAMSVGRPPDHPLLGAKAQRVDWIREKAPTRAVLAFG